MTQVQTIRNHRRAARELHSGDKMPRAEFHRIYEQMPEDFKAELIGGIVYVASPLGIEHGANHLPLGSVLFAFEGATPGVQSGDNATIILGEDSEPQPDLFLRIKPEYGGQSSTTTRNFVEGPPELVAEIAYSGHSLDLHAKRRDYARYGVLEYLVLSLKEQQLKWFDLSKDRELNSDREGICRIHAFPGLWIHVDALLQRNHQLLMSTLKSGLESPEHTRFVQKLAAARRKKK
ncbi:MAG TPA: Uma2 family endonuclease [Tepidisphaeraceae bacterium]|jgi:Uma2 family endonuclease|nr:Uma2 family endonuclease [Tepidisphaeraceae bacterium]